MVRSEISKIYIGIDPDLIKSGVAFYFKNEEVQLRLELRTFWQLASYLAKIKELGTDFEVIIEAGWLNKKYNFRETVNKTVGERIAFNVGQNTAVGKLLHQTCLELQIPCKLVKPTQSKVNSAYFEKLTGLKVKNQELIDAGMLVFGI